MILPSCWIGKIQQWLLTRPPLRRFPFLGGVCNSGVATWASLSLSATLSALAWPFAERAGLGAGVCESAGVGGSAICTGAAAVLVGSAEGICTLCELNALVCMTDSSHAS